MIHCDEVFDILTRGPFPTGAPSDGIVEAHLNHCAPCRQLAEALRPAIELLQEAISPEESDRLPRYGGAAPPRPAWSGHGHSPIKTEPQIACPVARAAAPRFSSQGLPWRAVAKFMAAACVGLAVAGMLRQIALSHGAPPRTPASLAYAASWRTGVGGNEWVNQQNLQASCREVVAGYALNVPAAGGSQVGDAMQLTCCLGCHAAHRGQTLPAELVGGFVLACQACH